MAKRLTPQQKKELSYEHDRRNAYGQNAKASRKAIPRRKASVRRRYRHGVSQELRAAQRISDAEEADLLDAKVAAVKLPGWRKCRDLELKKHVEYQLERRSKPGRSREGLEERRREAEAWTRFSAEHSLERRKFLNSLEQERLGFARQLDSERKGFARRLRADRGAFELRLEVLGEAEARARRLDRLAEERELHRAFSARMRDMLRDFEKREQARIDAFRAARRRQWREWREARGMPASDSN